MTRTLSSFLICFASLVAAPSSSAGEFRPNDFEVAYANIGPAFASPSLCDRISPKAYTTAGFSPSGYRISYLRSACFLNAALSSADKDLCKEVKPISTLFLDGGKISPEECMAEIDRKSRPGDGPAFRSAELILKFLGHTDADLRISGDNPARYHFAYNDIKHSKRDPRVAQGFKERLHRLPSFAVGDDDARKEIDALFPSVHRGRIPNVSVP